MSKQEAPFEIKFFASNNDIERRIERYLQTVFDQNGKPDYTGVVFTCLKELINNAAKANLKRVLFENSRLDIDNEESYLKAMLRFKELLTESNYQKFEKDLKNKNYWIEVRLIDDEGGLMIEVINNAHITKIEDKRLREKLKKAMAYEEIVQFYLEQGDEIEGAGMGIALIIILLKGLKVDPSLFRMGNTKEGYTIARLEIPLNAKFVGKRDSNE